jgi:hypothetical protein
MAGHDHAAMPSGGHAAAASPIAFAAGARSGFGIDLPMAVGALAILRLRPHASTAEPGLAIA